MKKIVVYASNLGFAENIARLIASKLKIDTLQDVQTLEMNQLQDYEKIVLVVSTHGDGEIQRDFAAKLDDFKELDFTNKTVALVGLGDGIKHGETFNNAQGQLYDMAKDQGATLVGSSNPENYAYQETNSIRDGVFPGLVIDLENEDHLTQQRIDAWFEQVNQSL